MNSTNGRKRSPRQIAEISGVDLQSIYYFVRSHRLPHYRIGKKILISENDWLDFMNKHRQEPTERGI
jgi:excisionase family DNA binding protein